MKVKIYPSVASGSINSNVSKSDAHRALICAALAQGKSHIHFSGSNKDIEATIEVLKKLGAQIEVYSDEVIVQGCDPTRTISQEVFCNESGSTLRFLIPVFALSKQSTTFTGKGRLMERPQSVYEKFFADLSLPFQQKEGKISVAGPIRSGEYWLDGSVSSQFFTGLLFALPFVEGNSVIHVSDPFESVSYIRMTLKVLKAFGIQAQLVDHDILIEGNQSYKATDYVVEGDYSSSAFFALLGAINGPIQIGNLRKDSLQGDQVFFSFLQKAGAKVEFNQESYCVSPGPLQKIEVDLADCPDLGPVTMMLGCIAGKGMKLKNIARLRYKESDRVAAMKEELSKLGYTLNDSENEVEILPQRILTNQSVIELNGHNDHRIVMALAIGATVNNTPVVIDDCQAVNKSYPDFFEDLKKVHIAMEVIYD